jgi:hypothetical protein
LLALVVPGLRARTSRSLGIVVVALQTRMHELGLSDWLALLLLTHASQ